MCKYNLLYQKQIITANSSSLCSQSQFTKRSFATHITTQRLPKFYQDLQWLLLDSHDIGNVLLADIDQDTGLLITRPTDAIYRQTTANSSRNPIKEHNFHILKPYFRLAFNSQYLSQLLHTLLALIPTNRYFWLIITHPMTNQFTLGRVYTRNLTDNDLYVQHFQVAEDPIKSYRLKNN